MPDLIGLLPVDHRPLVEAEAAELRRSSGRRRHEFGDEPYRRQSIGEALKISGDAIFVGAVAGVRQITACPRPHEDDTRARMPPAQPGRRVGVVGEAEVLDRMRPTRVSALEVRPDPWVDAGL